MIKDMIEELHRWGCDMKGAMGRMADDEQFYFECLCEVVEDPYFETLKDALDVGNISAAFDAAHTLKGVLANMGLTPMYQQVAEIVELLRSGSRDGFEEKYARLMQMRAKLRTVIAQNKPEKTEK